MDHVPVPASMPATFPAPQWVPGQGQGAQLPANPSAALHAAPPTPVLHSSRSPAASIRAPVPLHVNADRNPSPALATVGKPRYRGVPRGLSPLVHAAFTGNLEQVQALIGQGHDVNGFDDVEDGDYTPLLAAAETGHVAVIDALLKAGADVNLKDGEGGDTALICAALHGHQAVVARLLAEPGIGVADIRQGGSNAFYCAAINGHAEIAAMLFDASMVPGGVIGSLMLAACRGGRLAIVQLMHLRGGVDLARGHGDALLHAAACNGHAQVVAYLLGAGADACRADSQGISPLQHACRRGHLAVVDAMAAHSSLNGGAALALTPAPLHIAAEEGHLPLLGYLLKAGADPNVQDARSGRTALMAAAENGQVDAMRLLMSCPGLKLDLCCASPDASLAGSDGYSAVHLAMRCGKRAAIVCLLTAGAKVAVPAGRGYEQSLLRWAIERSDCDIVRLLLEQWAAGSGQPAARCDAALAHAVQARCAGIVECLLEAGHAAAPPGPLVRFICQESDNRSRDALAGLVPDEQAHHAGAALAGHAGAMPEDGRPVSDKDAYASAIAIADLQLCCRTAADPWPDNVAARQAPLQAFSQLFGLASGHQQSMVHNRVNLLLNLHAEGLLMGVALPVADRITGCDPGLALLAGEGRQPNAHHAAMYYVAALSGLKPQHHAAAAARIFAASGAGALGVERLARVAHRQFEALQDLVGRAGAQLGEEMLEQIMPACIGHTDSRYRVDVAGLVAALFRSGLVPPFAHMLADRWTAAVASLLATPVAVPSGATFQQLTQILDEAMRGLGQSHLAASLLAALREADLLAELRRMTGALPADDVLPLLFRIQADQLSQYAEHLQRG